ncbi:putative disease resistance protein isoform X1 [Cinnamomum micranthum f. kanehirae]|uniref:Putative disease resistance protein isoform X1 n=1 Tax=Cinnamomum micranthum f. kanehirae TaxID=337451 RepID=A0A443PBB4_9MAGN|nr:putative disease resistance protein isoform X1 [Cinnamomum micranthum f. kanehirae]
MPTVGKTAELTKREILNCILGTEKKIIGVHGMGGVGKTTIMRNIHNDLSEQIKSKHFDCFIWITVSNDVDVNKLQRKIAKELKIDMEEDDDEDGAARRIFNALKRRKKFLLILDDMWDAFNLDEVGIPIPSEENGCKVVLTTRNKGICGHMQAHAIEVRVLSEEESWEFFKDIVVVGGVMLSKDIENLAKDVAKECCSLPLAIKTVGGSMCGVDNVAVWKCALKNLKEANGEF